MFPPAATRSHLLLALLVLLAAPLDVVRAQPFSVAMADTAARRAPASDSVRVATATAPATLVAGFGTVVFDGLVQAWYAGVDGDATPTFRLRRVQLKFTGRLSPRVRWVVMGDLAKPLTLASRSATVDTTNVLAGASVNQASRLLQDAYMSFPLSPRLRVDVGQHRGPQGLEGGSSGGQLDVIERARFIADRTRGGIGLFRDVGVSARGAIGRVDYGAGIFNGLGESQGETDRDAGKAVLARLAFRGPAGITVGAATAASDGIGPQGERQERWTADAAWRRGPISLRAEGARSRDGAIRRAGGYAHAGVRVRPDVELVARLDGWDPNTRTEATPADRRERDYLAGVTWQIVGANARLQANYLRRTFGAAPARDALLVNLQTSW